MEEAEREALHALIESDRVTAATRTALRARLQTEDDDAPTAFDAHDYATLAALCAAFAPSEAVPTDYVPRAMDRRLARGQGNGWRYARLPADDEAYRQALRALDALAQARHGGDFAALGVTQRHELLEAIKQGAVAAPEPGPDLGCFLEEVLAEFVELFYSHPLAMGEMGYIGFADAMGWQEVGLGQEDPLELKRPRPPAPTTPRATERLAMRRYATDEVVDVVVIGTGAGGAPLLARLAQAGLTVVALEAGPAFDYLAFATDERAQRDLFWLDERLSAGDDPLAFGNNNSGCGVGGSTLHFTGYVPRPQPDDFRLASEFGVGHDWPLSYDELEPYYDELEAFLGVSGPTPYPWGPPRRSGYPLPPLPLNGAAQLMQRACAALGIKSSPAPNAALSRPYHREEIGWRAACTNRGFCQAGCSVGAKGSMDVTFIPLAIARGAELRSGCFATGFERDSRGRITAVVYQDEGGQKRQRCRTVFLCGGAIETPRLLLINDFANSSGQVGRNLMAHVGTQLWGLFDEAIYPHKGIPAGLISEEMRRPRGVAPFASGYLLQSIGVMPITYVSQLARAEKLWGAALGDWMQGYNRTAGINIHGECLPYEHNFIELSDERDARGLPKPFVHFSNGENERQISAHAERLMRELWSAAGATAMWSFQRNAHLIGTCRMGRDAAEAVVNEEGRSFDVPNLYICDNSIFPSSLTVNPALTIMALSLRTADAFLARRGQ